MESLKPGVVARRTIGASGYERLRVKQMPSITGVRLIGTTPEIAKINKKLFDDFWSSDGLMRSDRIVFTADT